MTLKLSALVAVAAMVAAPSAAMSQTIEVIVPYGPGGPTDVAARIYADEFAKQIGETVIIRNIEGAGGTIGAARASEAEPDGQTLLYAPLGPIALQVWLRDTPYSYDQWSFICQTTNTPVYLMVRADSDVQDFDDFLERGKSEQIVYGSGGPGSIPHISVASIVSQANLNGLHVPYSGAGPALSAMAGGEIEFFADVQTTLETNDVRPLAIFADERSEQYPDVPTMTELGFPLTFSTWFGLFGPQGISEETVDRYDAACEDVLNSDAMRKFSEQTKTEISYRGPEDFKDFVTGSAEAGREALKAAGVIQ